MAKHNDGSNLISITVAVVTVGLFLGWLATREAPQTAVVSEPGDTVAGASSGAGSNVSGDVVTLDPDEMEGSGAFAGLVGQTVAMKSLNVVAGLNDRLFWVQLAAGELFLVQMADALVAAGQTAPTSGRIDVVGVVQTKDAALLDSWMADGTLRSADDRLQAEFGQTYLEAQQVQAAGAGN